MDEKIIRDFYKTHHICYDPLTHKYFTVNIIEIEKVRKKLNKIFDEYKRKEELYLPFLEALYRICGRGF